MRRSIPFLALILFLIAPMARAQTNTNVITPEVIAAAEKVMGLEFSDEKNDMLRSSLTNRLKDFQTIREFPLSNSIPSAMLFNPIPVGFKFETSRRKFKPSPLAKTRLPANLDDIAFYSIEQLAAL